MLNYDTILSSYDDKLTLMQWLKKVEAALKDASAVSFKVNKTGDATLTFSVVFNDGSEIVSGPITLQQGESVASAYIQNGNLHLVLTNGDDLNAGNMFNGDVTIAGSLAAASVKTPSLTSDGDEIAAQKPVIEIMTGYSFLKNDTIESQCNFNYVSVCKNGNKITFAFLVELTPSVNWSPNVSVRLGKFIVPTSIFVALVPSLVGSISAVSCTRGYAFDSVNSGVGLDVFFQRLNLNEISIVIYPDTEMQAERKYTLRHELTFLLSDNLAA